MLIFTQVQLSGPISPSECTANFAHALLPTAVESLHTKTLNHWLQYCNILCCNHFCVVRCHL